ncbi:MAG: recombination protein RecR [Alphaproteobacteria bacterium]|jgi:recombination protein RecR
MAVGEIDRLVQFFARLPGLGPRSARRVVLFLIKRRESLMLPLAQALESAAHAMRNCTVCGNVDVTDPCAVCVDPRRDPSLICVVEDVADMWALERAMVFSGRYHVLGGALSALDGKGPEDLLIEGLVERARSEQVTEIILATSATVEGQTTAHYVAERLEDANVKISGLAHGVPIGGELDYLDDGTLSAALKERRTL